MTITNHQTRVMVALNADVVNYSRLMADDFDATTTAVEQARELVEREVARHGGTLSSFVGDNFMALFGTPIEALGAAIAISSALAEDGPSTPSGGKLRFRMGIDQGTVFESAAHRYFGDALNIAARIQAIAPAGGVSVSGKVYRALDEPALRFRALGRHELKNIPEEIEVFEFADLPAEGPARSAGGGLAFRAPAVAVLPIHVEGLEEAQRGIAESLRSDLIHHLAEVPNLRVVEARVGMGADLNATSQYMLETGVYAVEDHVNVYAKLLDIATLNLVATHRWSSPSDKLYSLSEQISDEVARSLQVELVVGEPARIYTDLIDDPAALHDIYEGWYLLFANDRFSWLRSLEIFERLTTRHPKSRSFGHALLALAHWLGAGMGVTDDPAAAHAEAAREAQSAIEAGDPTGLGQMVQAALLLAAGQPTEALATIDGLDRIRPTCDITYAVEGSVRRYMGQWERSLDLLDTAIRLTPVTVPWYPTVQACSLYLGGRVDEAAATADAVLDYQPNNLEALLVLAAAQSEMGLHRRAAATAEVIEERFPNVDVAKWLDDNPYQVPEIVDRWKASLQQAGVLARTD